MATPIPTTQQRTAPQPGNPQNAAAAQQAATHQSIPVTVRDDVSMFVAAARNILAQIERDLTNSGANALDSVRASIKQIEKHIDGIHQTAHGQRVQIPTLPPGTVVVAPTQQAPGLTIGAAGEAVQTPAGAPAALPPGATAGQGQPNAGGPDPFVNSTTETNPPTMPNTLDGQSVAPANNAQPLPPASVNGGPVVAQPSAPPAQVVNPTVPQQTIQPPTQAA